MKDTDLNSMKERVRNGSNQKKKSPLLLIIVLCLVAIAVALYIFKDRIFQENATPSAEMKEEIQAYQERVGELEEEVAILQSKIDNQLERISRLQSIAITDNKTAIRDADIDDFFDKGTEEAPAEKVFGVMEFFSYIEDKGYLLNYSIEERAYERFEKIIESLRESSPVVSGETQDLMTILKNIAYFYRVLGKQNIFLLRDIINKERALMEHVMEIFFNWINPLAMTEDPEVVSMPFSTWYEYSAFFLHTIGGQAYLMRRDSKIRILTTYYCVIVLDRANRLELNRYGLDIRPYIDSVIRDIENYRDLKNRKKYLHTLEEIKTRY